MISETEDKITRALTHGITRRTVFQRSARAALVVGGALAAPMALFTGKATASNCGIYGEVGTWGCYCAPETPRCGGNLCCNGNCCSPLRRRCTYWTQENNNGQMCWCSLTCNYSGTVGRYHCCDCWTGGSGGCTEANGASKCLCAQFAAS